MPLSMIVSTLVGPKLNVVIGLFSGEKNCKDSVWNQLIIDLHLDIFASYIKSIKSFCTHMAWVEDNLKVLTGYYDSCPYHKMNDKLPTV